MEHGMSQIISRQLWRDEHELAVDQFRYQAEKSDLKIEDADMAISYLTWIDGEDGELGYFWPAPEEVADYVNVAYRWKS